MRTEFTPFYEDAHAATQSDADQLSTDTPADPRLRHLSPATRAVITQGFGSDMDEACYWADRLNGLYRHPPDWVKELAGPKAGWRDLARTRC